MISIFSMSFIRTAVFAAAVLTVATASFAQSDSNEPSSDVKQETSKVQFRVKPTEPAVKDVMAAPADDLVAVKGDVIEPLQTAARYDRDVRKETSARLNFSDETPAKSEAPAEQATDDDSGWQFAVAPYFYMTGLSGRVGARGRVADVDLSFGDVLKKFKFGLMGAIEAKKGRFVLFNDIMWIKLDEETNTPGGLYSTAQVGVNLFVWDAEAGYRVYESDRGTFDLLGGARIMSVETNLNFRAGILPAFDVSQRKTWATPIAGFRGVVNVTPKVFLSAKFDIGGGVGADFTDQIYAGAGYRFTPKIAFIGGYRYFKTDYDDDAGFLYDASMNGIVIGAKFAF